MPRCSLVNSFCLKPNQETEFSFFSFVLQDGCLTMLCSFRWTAKRPSHTYACVHAKSLHLCLTLCEPTDCSLPGSSVHGILQARILEWVAMLSSRGSSRPSDRTPALAGRFFTTSATWEAPATHIHVFNSPPKSPPRGSRLPHNMEQNSLCHTVGPYLLPILNTAVCTCLSQTPEKCECQCVSPCSGPVSTLALDT